VSVGSTSPVSLSAHLTNSNANSKYHQKLISFLPTLLTSEPSTISQLLADNHNNSSLNTRSGRCEIWSSSTQSCSNKDQWICCTMDNNIKQGSFKIAAMTRRHEQ
jgi:hypothetical protein